MTSKRCSFAIVVLAALCGTAMTPAQAETTLAVELAKSYKAVLANPTDTAANLAYARLAEQAGQLRKALATYERILLYEPDNEEARTGLYRVRSEIEPTKTLITVSGGAGYESNPLQYNTDFQGDFKALATVVVEDERRLGDQRWRTVVLGNAEYFADTYELDYGYLGAQTGPMIETVGGVTINPFIGGGVSSLENDYYFSEGLVGASFKGYLGGAYQTLRVSAGYRSFNDTEFPDMSDGFFADAIARISRPSVITDNDVLVFIPHVRWSAVGGADLGFGIDTLQPGKFFEWGAGFMYYDDVVDWLTLGIGFDAQQTIYGNYQTIDGNDRQDWTLTPIASAVFNNALGYQTDLALDYRFDWNHSNDDYYDYGNHIFEARVVTRF
ncbi:tetratricopeptide repeat protein [Kaistia dalseonensis]|uniref:Tetratricopeptide (TPR) repeat protein n=1 Tax=Kaistia dalseonensis TaxID=410840 RepID=A0ABU0HD02_9HYPH|nr:tetratricopeptide repeat protein [Kaistia dalseonensis]MCX5497559.1 tetratricopeptide repeat protein [Kaistia dalseonensis]MDQ0440199.1 tetratricopeptide (TPR) repeat protein [Kaistia dalseonensis]